MKKVIHADTFVKILLETKPREHPCPLCGTITKRIHDYRMQTIKDLPFQLKHCYLLLKKRRYVCPCGKRFYENYSFLSRYLQRISRLTTLIVSTLHDTNSIASVAKMCNVSPATVNRVLDTIAFRRLTLSSTLFIDEFKGNAGGEKYQCILVDPAKHSVVDILHSRSQTFLTSYFRKIPKAERYRVKFFVCYMWLPYTDLAKTFFSNTTIIIDKYYFIRQTTWTIESVRKRLQKTMPATLRKYYKRSRSLILTRYDRLKGENKRACASCFCITMT